jgi:hypothetical protein
MLWNGFVRNPFLFNVAINASLPWLLYRDRDALSIWGGPESLHREMIGTAVLLPLLTAWICGRVLTRQKSKKHRSVPMPILSVVDRNVDDESSELRSPSLRFRFWQAVGRLTGDGSWVGGILFTLVCGPLVYATGWMLATALTEPTVSIIRLSIIKAVFAGLHGCWVTPLYAASVLVSQANQSRGD